MSELAWLGAVEAAAAIRDGRLSSREYVARLLARIERLNPSLDAFVHVESEAALAAAGEADAAVAAGRALGALHGVPFGLKDIIDAAGLRTTAHSKILADSPPAGRDATVTARLRAAGAILLGKLATHEFAFGGPCFDLPWPPARNPWDRRLFTGGSSSGSGAAVAGGLLPLALGTDTAGSVRNPASLCGLVGLKPSYGRVSRAGVIPLAFSLDHVGPMTRTVAENALLLGVIAGHDASDPASARVPVPDYAAAVRAGLERGVSGLRIGVIRHFYREDMVADARVDDAIEAALQVLAGLGASVREVRTHALREFTDTNRVILIAEGFAIHREWLVQRPADYAKMTRDKLLPGAFLGAADYVQATRNRRHYTAAVDRLLEDVDLLVTASGMDPPYPLDDPDAPARYYPRQARAPFNLTGHPAMSLPVGFTEAGHSTPPLPVSMQLVGRHFDESTLYRAAAAYEQATGWWRRHRPAP
jgi:aspartyl-tRNA(Asn)/glutamyl-tRNA(Gln) amidotransferase subunit A